MTGLPRPQIDWNRADDTAPIPDLCKDLAQWLGYPRDVPLEYHVETTLWRRDDTEADLGTWPVEVVGIPICSLPEDPAKAPDFLAYGYRQHPDGPMLWVRAISISVPLPISKAEIFVHQTYRADGSSRVDLCGIQTLEASNAHFEQMMKFAREAVAVLGTRISEQGVGRPIGSGQLVTAHDVSVRYWEWVDAHGKPPTQDDPQFSQEFYLQPRQFKEKLKQLHEREGFLWPPSRPSSL